MRLLVIEDNQALVSNLFEYFEARIEEQHVRKIEEWLTGQLEQMRTPP